jgi:integrase
MQFTYQIRHTTATLWLASGEAPEWIARQLGHSSTEMLFRVYSRYVPNLTRQDGSAIDRLLASRFASGGNQPATPTRTASGKNAEGSGVDAVAQNAQPPPSALRQAVPPH